jgi:hypothetical protein
MNGRSIAPNTGSSETGRNDGVVEITRMPFTDTFYKVERK